MVAARRYLEACPWVESRRWDWGLQRYWNSARAEMYGHHDLRWTKKPGGFAPGASCRHAVVKVGLAHGFAVLGDVEAFDFFLGGDAEADG